MNTPKTPTNLPSNSPWGSGTPTKTEVSADVAELLDALKAKTAAHTGSTTGRGRLIFALDATASRQPTWDQACHIQGEMFEATASLGGLDIQLTYYRGFNECKASRWMTTAADLHRVMRSVSCVGGYTQLERVLEHTIRETGKQQVNALVFVGDAMEEQVDRLAHLAGELGTARVPIFCFHEGSDLKVEAAFKQLALLSRGHYLVFDLANVGRLRELLGAIAVYATGNRQALLTYAANKGGEVLRLARQMYLPRPGASS
jgi:hypothetical protein